KNFPYTGYFDRPDVTDHIGLALSRVDTSTFLGKIKKVYLYAKFVLSCVVAVITFGAFYLYRPKWDDKEIEDLKLHAKAVETDVVLCRNDSSLLWYSNDATDCEL